MKMSDLPLMRQIPANPFAFLWEALYGFQRWAVVGIICAFALSLSKILLPVFFSNMVAYFSTITPNDFSWATISIFLLQMLSVFVGTSLLRFVREYVEAVFVRNPLRIKLSIFGLDYIAGHSENYMAGQKAGQISQKILGLKDNTSKLHVFVTRMASCLFLIGITFFFIGRISIVFVLITVIVGLISGYFSYRQSFILKDLNKEVVDTRDRYWGTLVDSISNVLTVKAFGRETYEQQMVMKYYDAARRIRLIEIAKMQDVISVQRALMAIFEISGALIALYWWYHHQIDVGDVTLILMLQKEALTNFKRFLEEISNLNRVYGEVASSLTPFLVQHEIVDLPEAASLKVDQGAIMFEHIRFAYHKNKVFENFCLEIKPKEKIGIVGRSGAGKSTLINLLLHQYQLDGGRILIDGQDVSQVSQASLFENIALIPQDTALFHRTVTHNIAYGNPQARQDELIRASCMAYADEFIRELPQGYSTTVGEKGIKLSGGQRQRVAMARAILKNSPILILDEATSALDNESEYKVSQSLKSLMEGKTVIAIAHRLSTLKEMDRIVVMDRGRIVEAGTPEELIDKNGQFAKLWNLQNG